MIIKIQEKFWKNTVAVFTILALKTIFKAIFCKFLRSKHLFWHPYWHTYWCHTQCVSKCYGWHLIHKWLIVSQNLKFASKSIRLLKEPSGPQECRLRLIALKIGFMLKNWRHWIVKILFEFLKSKVGTLILNLSMRNNFTRIFENQTGLMIFEV